jgi:hypothetical protein
MAYHIKHGKTFISFRDRSDNQGNLTVSIILYKLKFGLHTKNHVVIRVMELGEGGMHLP